MSGSLVDVVVADPEEHMPHSPRRRPIRRLLLTAIDPRESGVLADLLRSSSVGGAIALAAAAVALLWANLATDSYASLRALELGPLDLEHWTADGALAVFFFVAGLELKREVTVGSLRRPADAVVPVAAACCGVALPALIYLGTNLLGTQGAGNLAGWAIPAATDIAFALAVLAVAAPALPTQLRTFLLTLAVVDDLIVIVIIAVFYTDTLTWGWLGAAVALCAAYGGLQRARVRTGLVYLPLAALTWWCLLHSGIHATIAGVALGLLTRTRLDAGEERSPAERLEHLLSPVSAGVCVPLFALLSAGVVVGTGDGLLDRPVLWGVVLGLVVGKPLGVLGGTWLTVKLTRAELSPQVRWGDLAGIALVAGIGFTVSLLVSDLSFGDERREEAKTAVLLGSAISGAVATLVLTHRNRAARAVDATTRR